MKSILKATICGAAVGILAGCAAEPAGDTIEPLQPTTIVVDGKEYTVTRSLRTIDGETSEGWSVVVDGLAVSCPEPTKLSCTNAVQGFSI